MGDRTDVGGGGVATFVDEATLHRLRTADGAEGAVTLAFATACRINALGMIQLAGSGHIGSSFSSLDIVSWLLLHGLDPDDVSFSSKGHDVPGLYAALVGIGRLPFELVTQLRRLDGLPGHPDVRTPGIAFNTGSLGMGISKAKGLLAADRIVGRDRRVVVLTGDGELQEGQIWESLATAVRDRLDGLTVIVDRNRLQSDLPVAEVSDLGDLARRFEAFGWSATTIDGHDPVALSVAFRRKVDGPRVIIADTVKSRGVGFLEPAGRPADERFYPFHSGALSPDVYGRARDELLDRLESQAAALGVSDVGTVDLERHPVPTWPGSPSIDGPSERLVPAYGRALVAAAAARDDIVVLDADLMIDLELVEFRDRFPQRFIECGIAEQDMVSQASGLARSGLLPIVHSFASFLSARPMEQAMNAASEGGRIGYVAALGGLLPATPGHSHQGVQDIGAFTRAEATVVAPSSELAVEGAVRFLVEHHGSVYLRLCSLPTSLPFPAAPLPALGTGTVVHTATDPTTIVLAYGPVLLGEAVRAVRSDPALAASVTVVDIPWVNAVDHKWLARTIDGTTRIVVLDDHDVRSGLGVHVATIVAGSRALAGIQVEILGVEGLPECGTPAEVLAHHGLDATSLALRFSAET
jgi:transketolase